MQNPMYPDYVSRDSFDAFATPNLHRLAHLASCIVQKEADLKLRFCTGTILSILGMGCCFLFNGFEVKGDYIAYGAVVALLIFVATLAYRVTYPFFCGQEINEIKGIFLTGEELSLLKLKQAEAADIYLMLFPEYNQY